jgi:hypothetical protein
VRSVASTEASFIQLELASVKGPKRAWKRRNSIRLHRPERIGGKPLIISVSIRSMTANYPDWSPTASLRRELPALRRELPVLGRERLFWDVNEATTSNQGITVRPTAVACDKATPPSGVGSYDAISGGSASLSLFTHPTGLRGYAMMLRQPNPWPYGQRLTQLLLAGFAFCFQ